MTTIKLDFDVHDRRKLKAILRGVSWHLYRMEELLALRAVEVNVYRTRHGMHVQVEVVNAVPALELVAIQAIMGSDPFRETLNLHRVLSGRFEGTDYWNTLFDARTKWTRGRKADTAKRTRALDLEGYFYSQMERRGNGR